MTAIAKEFWERGGGGGGRNGKQVKMCSSPSSFIPCLLYCQEKNNTGSFTPSS